MSYLNNWWGRFFGGAEYPYTDSNRYNDDWLLMTIKALIEEIDNFVNLNTIKYADPIQWEITRQYEKNTVVIDPNSGTAYLSTKPVPRGVLLTNDNYWAVIFTLDIIASNKNITLRDDGANLTSTFESSVGDWLMWQGVLYKVTRNISLGTTYVVGYNLERYTVELFLREAVGELNTTIETSVNTINNKIGDLSNLTTTDKTSIVNAINEVESVVNNVKIPHVVDVTNVGVIADGVTDNTTILQSLLDSGDVALYFPSGEYVIGDLTISNNVKIYGDGDTSILKPANANTVMFTLHNEKSFECCEVLFDGSDNSCTLFDFENVINPKIHDISIVNITKCFKVNGSRSMRINNIWQVGDCANSFTYNGNNYNFDLIVDGWQVDTNSTPSQTDPWFDLTGMVCTLWSNMVTQGRMECDGFYIHGFNEGTFFSNIVLVCPKVGFNIRKRPNEVFYPGCVQLENVSVDQYYTSGIIVEGYWIMVNNSAFVNGNQRNATDSAIVILNESIRVFFNNVISYNNTYQMFNIGTAKHVKISNCIGYNSDIGAVYVCPTQSFDNPQVVNCTFESVNANGLTMKNGSFNHIVTSQGLASVSLTTSYQNVYTVSMPASALEEHQVIEINAGIEYNDSADIQLDINGTTLDLSHTSGNDVIRVKMLRNPTGYLVNAINKNGVAYTSFASSSSLDITVKAKSANGGTLYGTGFTTEIK